MAEKDGLKEHLVTIENKLGSDEPMPVGTQDALDWHLTKIESLIGGGSGSLGPTGPQGPVGPIGPTGTAGKDGEDGAVGPTGTQGEAGPIGPTGAQGLIGPTGVAGQDGLTTSIEVNGAEYEQVNGKITLPDYPITEAATETDIRALFIEYPIKGNIISFDAFGDGTQKRFLVLSIANKKAKLFGLDADYKTAWDNKAPVMIDFSSAAGEHKNGTTYADTLIDKYLNMKRISLYLICVHGWEKRLIGQLNKETSI